MRRGTFWLCCGLEKEIKREWVLEQGYLVISSLPCLRAYLLVGQRTDCAKEMHDDDGDFCVTLLLSQNKHQTAFLLRVISFSVINAKLRRACYFTNTCECESMILTRHHGRLPDDLWKVFPPVFFSTHTGSSPPPTQDA